MKKEIKEFLLNVLLNVKNLRKLGLWPRQAFALSRLRCCHISGLDYVGPLSSLKVLRTLLGKLRLTKCACRAFKRLASRASRCTSRRFARLGALGETRLRRVQEARFASRNAPAHSRGRRPPGQRPRQTSALRARTAAHARGGAGLARSGRFALGETRLRRVQEVRLRRAESLFHLVDFFITGFDRLNVAAEAFGFSAAEALAACGAFG